MSIKQRSELRIKKKLFAGLSNGEFETLGMASNLSKNGIFVLSEQTFKPGSTLAIDLAVKNEIYSLKGEVKWTEESPFHDDVLNHGIGIHLTQAQNKYLHYINMLVKKNIKFFKSSSQLH